MRIELTTTDATSRERFEETVIAPVRERYETNLAAEVAAQEYWQSKLKSVKDDVRFRLGIYATVIAIHFFLVLYLGVTELQSPSVWKVVMLLGLVGLGVTLVFMLRSFLVTGRKWVATLEKLLVVKQERMDLLPQFQQAELDRCEELWQLTVDKRAEKDRCEN